ncbi:MAG: homocysteine S-methyltransferase family protein, partial [Oscillospiraceae bacterium]|nr:homocysteine S-methyltransferase family protein [Oscillospiraceae bacterium]
MTFREFLKDNIVVLDSGMGTLLQEKGITPGERSERWSVTHADVVRGIHKAYFDAGSNVVNTNSFGATRLHFAPDEMEEIIAASVENAKWAREHSIGTQEKFIALDIGPLGRLLKPFGDLDFEDAVALFAEEVRLGVRCGVDLVTIETMNDSYETKAALLAVRENCDLPVIVTNAYGEDGKLMTGASPEAMCAMLEGMGADAVGANCSLGPRQLFPVMERLLDAASVPAVLKPNAGLPRIENGKTVFDVGPAEFARDVSSMVQKGVRVVGGCCGTTPEHIAALVAAIADLKPQAVTQKEQTVVSSYTHAVTIGDDPVLIGERINPTGKKRFKQALVENDIEYILNEGLAQQEKGVHILDVNVGIPDIDEKAMLTSAVCELQSIIDLPLQIDTADALAMEAALRRYNGKALVNSVSGKKESMEAVFPLVKKYGGTVIALTLDENGIPATADGRVAIARNILAVAKEYGIAKKDVVFDTLAMTVSADQTAAKVTLEALGHIREELGCRTSLGVSNVSFGLPARDAVNAAFFAMALQSGLSAAIMNPNSEPMMKTYHAYRLLAGRDENCADYIAAAEGFSAAAAAAPTDSGETLRGAIVKGLRDKAGELAKKLLETVPPLVLVEQEIIPALDVVGVGFENKTVYLPQLLMSAESAKAAFEHIRTAVAASGDQRGGKGKIIIATVRGDIHDIGKNIVKLLLENYGFDVVDLGKDVKPEEIADAAVR